MVEGQSCPEVDEWLDSLWDSSLFEIFWFQINESSPELPILHLLLKDKIKVSKDWKILSRNAWVADKETEAQKG